MSSPLHVVRAGNGPLLVLVHGSATDHATWTIQLATRLPSTYRVVSYDRRGAGASPLPGATGRSGDAYGAEAPALGAGAVAWLTIEEHAADLAALIEAEGGGPAIVAGSSCGAVVTLELCRRFPTAVRSAVLIEPPLPPSDEVSLAMPGFLRELDRLAAEDGPAAAAERFLITVLGEEAWARLPRAFRERSSKQWPQIRGDCHALDAYQVRYAELGAITTPIRLLGGDRSAAYFRPTLEALAAALGNASLAIVAGGGHMLHAETPRAFAEHIDAMA